MAKKAATTSAGSAAVKPSPRQSFQDWVRLPGAAKQHKNTRTGEVLSDRQYRQQFLYQGKTLEAVQSTRKQPREAYGRLLRARRDYLSSHGVQANLNQVRTSADMKSIVSDLKRTEREYKRLTKGGKQLSAEQLRKLYGPKSAAARALVDLGYRDPNAQHWVGDS